MTETQNKSNYGRQTFCGRYDRLRKEEAQRQSPPVAFVKAVAKATRASEVTVYQWCTGRRRPDALARQEISKLLGVDEKILFPETAN